jgi:FAD/FMN-containing dehydrogenase
VLEVGSAEDTSIAVCLHGAIRITKAKGT